MQEAHLEASRSSLGDLHPDTLVAKSNLGVTLLSLGCLTQARVLLEVAWQDCRRVVGKHHPDTLTAMENLALALNNDGELDRALLLQKKALKWRRRSLGEDHPETLEAMGNLASTFNNMAVELRNAGNLEDALPLQMKALEMMVKAYGDESLNVACVYSATGALFKLMGGSEEASRYFHKSLEIRERELGSDAELSLLVRTRLRGMLH
jgi:tetratricopeptide (TPR) repeat protein